MSTEKVNTRLRNLCFTAPADNFDVKILETYGDHDIKYVVCGKETGKNGYLHYQGYVEFTKKKSFKQCKELLGLQTHIESRRGTAKQASDYCKKDGEFVEYGDISRQGARTDLKVLCDEIRSGETTMEDILRDDPYTYHQYHNTLDLIKQRYTSPLPTKLWQLKLKGILDDHPKPRRIIWIKGDFGCGKSEMSRYIIDEMNGICLPKEEKEAAYIYKGQRIAFWDLPGETNNCDIPYGFMEKLNDGFFVSTKFHAVMRRFDPPHVVVFSNQRPHAPLMDTKRFHVIEVGDPAGATGLVASLESEPTVPTPPFFPHIVKKQECKLDRLNRKDMQEFKVIG